MPLIAKCTHCQPANMNIAKGQIKRGGQGGAAGGGGANKNPGEGSSKLL
jgi:hypothetical protein